MSVVLMNFTCTSTAESKSSKKASTSNSETVIVNCSGWVSTANDGNYGSRYIAVGVDALSWNVFNGTHIPIWSHIS